MKAACTQNFTVSVEGIGPNHGYLKAACTLSNVTVPVVVGPNHGYLKAACTILRLSATAGNGPNHGYLKAACTRYVMSYRITNWSQPRLFESRLHPIRDVIPNHQLVPTTAI